LKRAIQQQIENPLAQQILSGELIPGKVIRLEVKDDRLWQCSKSQNAKTSRLGSFLFKNQAK
jgi:ATP-dependent Clp protease ATP-binding subunit ClpB